MSTKEKLLMKALLKAVENKIFRESVTNQANIHNAILSFCVDNDLSIQELYLQRDLYKKESEEKVSLSLSKIILSLDKEVADKIVDGSLNGRTLKILFEEESPVNVEEPTLSVEKYFGLDPREPLGVAELSKKYFHEVIAKNEGNFSAAARELGLSRYQLRKKIKE